MAVLNYTDLYDKIAEIVYLNESKLVKAEKLQELLIDMIDSSTNLKYDTNRTYGIGAFCVYDPGSGYKAYVCIGATGGAFVPADWEQIGV